MAAREIVPKSKHFIGISLYRLYALEAVIKATGFHRCKTIVSATIKKVGADQILKSLIHILKSERMIFDRYRMTAIQ